MSGPGLPSGILFRREDRVLERAEGQNGPSGNPGRVHTWVVRVQHLHGYCRGVHWAGQGRAVYIGQGSQGSVGQGSTRARVATSWVHHLPTPREHAHYPAPTSPAGFPVSLPAAVLSRLASWWWVPPSSWASKQGPGAPREAWNRARDHLQEALGSPESDLGPPPGSPGKPGIGPRSLESGPEAWSFWSESSKGDKSGHSGQNRAQEAQE